MYLKRYRTPTVREALARAREELGPHALVLSTRVVPKRGLSGWLGAREVEITTAVDRPVSEPRPPRTDDAGGRSRPATDEPAVARLVAAGLEPTLAEEVAAAVPWSQRRGASVTGLRRALAGWMAPMVAADEALAPVELFVGPPGSGKTTTIAKLAAQERVRRGRRVALVAADAHRVGAAEQLSLYADVIGAAFVAVRTTAEAERALSALSGPVLVDTAGHSARDASTREVFERLAGRPGVRTSLVVPAWSSRREFERLLATFEPARPDRLVLTRLDEVESLASLVGPLRACRIPVALLATGQRVPEDLERASADRLAGWVLGEQSA